MNFTKKDGLSIMLFQNAVYAEKEHPEIRLVTDDIDEVYRVVAGKFPELLHPNLSEVTPRPWGLGFAKKSPTHEISRNRQHEIALNNSESYC